MFHSACWGKKKKKNLLEIFTAHVGARKECIYALPRIYIHPRDLNIHKPSCLLDTYPWLFSLNEMLLSTSLCTRHCFVHWGYSMEEQSPALTKLYILIMSTKHLKYGQNRTINFSFSHSHTSV